jgi:Tfp pilus assembly protein PilN
MTQQINLYNPLFRKKSFSLISAAGMLCAVGIASAGAVLAAAYQQHELRQLEAQAQAIERAYTATRANRDKLAAEVEKHVPNMQLEAEVAALEKQLNDREEVIAALKSGAVGSTDGFSDYLRAFSRQSISGLWLTGFDIAQAGNALALQGRTLSAEHVASYLKRLNQEKTMQGRQFAAMRISQPPPQPPAASNAVALKDAKTRKPSPPRYLEFTISTLDIADNARPAVNIPIIAPPLLGPLTAAAGAAPAQIPGGQAGAR